MRKGYIKSFPKYKWVMVLFTLVFAIIFLGTPTAETLAAASSTTTTAAGGATTSVYIVEYKADGKTVASEKTVDYKWMMQNLPVYGDGTTHYYHQGPVFEGDAWDPSETVNLKDKGAVKGTNIKDLCDLVGGMSQGGEVVIHAVDGYEITLAYSNIYQPLDIQGPVVLCWYKGNDAATTDSGYPADAAYSSALQVVFMAKTTNSDGQYVFGNSDMKIALPQAKYQHFYEAGLPSTSGLSVKWIDELLIYPNGAPTTTKDTSTPLISANGKSTNSIPWMPIGLGIAGLLVISIGVYFVRRKQS